MILENTVVWTQPSYSVKDVIRVQKIDDVTVVLYTTEVDREQFPHINNDIPAVAFFEGNDQKGWKNVGPNGWTHYENDNMTVYTEHFRDHHQQGYILREILIIYGEIHNDEIVTIETKTNDKGDYVESIIIPHQGKRYYFHWEKGPIHTVIVRGLSNDGVVIDEQG